MTKEKTVAPKNETTESIKKRQTRLPQSKCPVVSIEDILIIPRAIKDNFAGQPTPPLLLAEACKISPTSSNWRTLTGAAIAYGVTDGGYNSKKISLTPLGERIVAPLKEGDDSIALKEAVMTPSILSEFYNQFDNNKLPKADIAYNILTSKGVPKDKVEATWDILKNNAKKAQILKIIGGNEYIFINKSVEISTTPEIEVEVEDLGTTDTEETIPADVLKKMNIVAPNPTMVQAPIKKK